MSKNDVYERLNVDEALFLFVDHQTGLFSLVNDYDGDVYYNNVMAMAKLAK